MNFLTRCYIRNALFILGYLWVAAPIPINAQNPSPLEVTTADGTKLHYVVEGSGMSGTGAGVSSVSHTNERQLETA